VRPSDLTTLEFPRLLAAVAGHAQSTPGREACLDLRPSTSLAAARAELERVAQYREITADEAPPLGDVPDVRPHLAVSRTTGARLSGLELREVAGVITALRRMRGFLRARGDGRPLLLAYLSSLHAFPELDRLLAAALDDEGGLRDDASPTLRALRRELRALRAEIESRLGRLFRQPAPASAIAEQYVTVRNGRYVVPVRAQAHGELPGIVQDRSASGETLFVEPLFAVESNNRILIAAREETQEEARILAELTAEIGRQSQALEEAFAALVELDTLGARAAFARRHDGVCPEIGGEAVVLRAARHPLLVLTGRPVTPIDVELDADARLLAVTGPNTGGKSVALKTLGLAVLAAQSGIPVLAAGDAALPLFDAVWTDIGDPQNVAGDLSTFSGHVRNLGEILAGATAASLVLLDEPGTGTDPEDGAALAKVLLRDLAERGARVLATTHFQSVKVFALAMPHARVAGVDFDPETFSPRYRLVYGSVGPSLGLTMARRLGLPEALLARAERDRGSAAADLATAVGQLEVERRRHEEAALRAEDERSAMHAVRLEQERLAAELRAKRERRWAEELGAAKEFADELRREGQRLLAEAKRSSREEARGRARRLIDLGRDQARAVVEKEGEIAAGLEAPADRLASAAGPAADGRTRPAVGDEVEVAGSGLRGSLLAIAGERAQIARGAIRFDVPARQLRRVSGPAADRQDRSRRTTARGWSHGSAGDHADADPEAEREGGAAPGEPSARPARKGMPALALAEINLVGERVRPALERLEAFLDRALLEERSVVRVIHGFGTGALRAAVREFLAGSSYVRRFGDADPANGGAGATIVDLGS
jgi:DNA mismatch repair protein MutS2